HLGAGAEPVLARLLLLDPQQDSQQDSRQNSRESESNRGTSGTGGEASSSKSLRRVSDEVRDRASRNPLGRLAKPLLQVKMRQLEERGAGLQPQILAAQSNGDLELLDRLMREKGALSGEIHRLKQQLRSVPRGGAAGGGEGREKP